MNEMRPATQEDLEIVYAWMNGGEFTPGLWTPAVDAAMHRVLDSAELLIQQSADTAWFKQLCFPPSGGAKHG